MSSVITIVAIGAAVGGYTAYESGQAQKDMANYNAKIAENEATAQQQAIEAEGRQLARDQRKLKGKQRANIAQRGGLEAGTDLLAMAESARQMQLDQLELQRQKGIAGTHGKSQADMYRFQGAQASSSSKWITGAIKGGTQGYNLGKSMQE